MTQLKRYTNEWPIGADAVQGRTFATYLSGATCPFVAISVTGYVGYFIVDTIWPKFYCTAAEQACSERSFSSR